MQNSSLHWVEAVKETRLGKYSSISEHTLPCLLGCFSSRNCTKRAMWPSRGPFISRLGSCAVCPVETLEPGRNTFSSCSPWVDRVPCHWLGLASEEQTPGTPGTPAPSRRCSEHLPRGFFPPCSR